MKKLLLGLITLLIPIGNLVGNPIVLPQAIVSELKLEENNKWLLEISFQYGTPYLKSQFDSICMVTSGGFSRIRLDNIADNTDICVITSDSLRTPLSIDEGGDCIKLYSFPAGWGSYPLVDSLCFGYYPGSIVDTPPPGYSIVRLSYDLFSQDKNPTMGLPNDTLGTCGTLTGKLYDKYNSLITKGNFQLDVPLSLQIDGTYSTNVYSRRVIFHRLLNNYQPNTYQWVEIDTLDLNIHPECQCGKDIHLLDSYTGVKENSYKPEYDISIMNYPNPFNLRTNFNVTIPISRKFTKKQITIYNALGQKINTIVLSNQLSVSWDGRDYSGSVVSSGTYYYQLVLDEKMYKSGSMILLK